MFKILLVEDEDLIRRGLKFNMNWVSVGCVVAGEAASGEEGLEKIEGLHPDIVITDIRMQNMNGLEMLRRGLELYSFHAIILTGYSEFEYAQQAIHLGVTEYILKPIDFDELKTCILRIVNPRQPKSQLPVDTNGPVTQLPDFRKIQNKYAKRMLQFIQDHYAEHILLTDLSQELNVSCTHLNAKFKAETGYTFHDFLNYYRINRAMELQKIGEFKLYEIAEKVGFSDYKYFNKVYKKYVGFSPNKISLALDY